LDINSDPDYLVYSCFGIEHLKYNCIKIFYTGENVRPNYNECDYSFSFDYPITERNYRLPIYKLSLDKLYSERSDIFKLTGERTDIDKICFKKNKFCNFIYSNANAKERIVFFHKLNNYKNVDSGGRLLNNTGFYVNDKLSFIRNYKFTIAFENTVYPGYTTEKIIYAFLSDSIPIYWGNPLISNDFNTKAFISCHDYNNFDEVIDRVIEIDNDHALYKKYIQEPVFTGNIENEFINENNILNRFETIFSKKLITTASKRSDLYKYYKYKIQKFYKKMRFKLTNP
jgi:hypothetical protein